MTRNEIASLLAKSEAGRSEAKIGDIRQLLKLLVAMDAARMSEGKTSLLWVLIDESNELVDRMRTKKATRKKK